jgi:hypothetical protein
MMKTKIRATARYGTAAVILAGLALLVNVISVSSGTASTKNTEKTGKYSASLPETLASPTLVEKILEYRAFFVRLNGYDKDLVCDISDLGENRVGLLLLEPSGFLKSLVFDRNTLERIHEDVNIPPKKVRASLARNAISVSDARLIAKNIAGLREEKFGKGKSARRRGASETPRREAMPQSLPDGFAPTRRKSAEVQAILDQMRQDVANNPNLASMTSRDILERFRSDVARRKEAACP